MLLIHLHLLLAALQTGLLGYGGGDALLTFAEQEIVARHAWLTAAQFADVAAVGRMTPGPAALNTLTLAGYAALYHAYGFWAAAAGSTVATLAAAAPSVGMAAAVERLRRHRRRAQVTQGVLTVLRLCTPGFVAAAVVFMATADSFGAPRQCPWDFGVSLFLFAATLAGTAYYRFHPLFMLLLCGAAGWLLF